MAFSLDNYEPVAVRLGRFLDAERDRSPRVRTVLTHYTDDRAVFRAELFLVIDGAEVLVATGWAEEIRGSSPVNRTSHLENAESSAIGRALANYGYAGSDPARRPSREEMGKVTRINLETREVVVPPLKPAYDRDAVRGEMPVRISKPATEKQVGLINRLFTEAGVADEDTARALHASRLLRRDVDLVNLTTRTASELIEALTDAKKTAAE